MRALLIVAAVLAAVGATVSVIDLAPEGMWLQLALLAISSCIFGMVAMFWVLDAGGTVKERPTRDASQL